MSPAQLRRARAALETFAIETPSWGFADTGTRFGKFFQDAAAIDLGDKLVDAATCTRSPAAARLSRCTCCGTSSPAKIRKPSPASRASTA